MGTGTKIVLGFSLSYFTLVMVKDGTLPKFVNNLATGANTLIGGLKPITGLA